MLTTPNVPANTCRDLNNCVRPVRRETMMCLGRNEATSRVERRYEKTLDQKCKASYSTKQNHNSR